MARTHVRAIQVEIPHNKANRDAITAKLTEHDVALDKVVTEGGGPVLATAEAAGAMSSALYNKLAALAPNGLADDFANIDCAYAAGASRIDVWSPGKWPVGVLSGMGLSAGNLPGGSVTPTGDASAWLTLSNPLIQSPKSAMPWAIAFEGSQAAPTPNKVGYIALRGVGSGVDGTYATLGIANDYNNYDHTHLCFVLTRQATGATTVVVSDWAIEPMISHRHTLAFDGTSLRLLVDGVPRELSVGGSPIGTALLASSYANFPQGPLFWSMYAHTALAVNVSRIAIATT